MKRPTFTIASLMVAVLFVAVGCMALRNPTPLMASAVFSLAVAILAAAVLLGTAGAVAGRLIADRDRSDAA